jgi:hypothetical protein
MKSSIRPGGLDLLSRGKRYGVVTSRLGPVVAAPPPPPRPPSATTAAGHRFCSAIDPGTLRQPPVAGR